MQMYVGELCIRSYAYGEGVSSPHNPLSPSASRQFRQRWFYACECTHAALSLEARHWLLKRVKGGRGWLEGEPFRTGNHGGSGHRPYVRYIETEP
ncbi:unnamed protein product [Leptosia nina]